MLPNPFPIQANFAPRSSPAEAQGATGYASASADTIPTPNKESHSLQLKTESHPMTDRTLELMKKHLNRDFQIFSCQESAPSAKDLESVAKDLGCILPDEFIAHSTGQFGGLYVEVKEEFWPRARELETGPFWSFLSGLYTCNISKEIPDYMHLADNARQFQTETSLVAIPFMTIITDPNFYCFKPDGEIARFNHDLLELEPVSLTFFELLDRELAALADRRERKRELLKSKELAAPPFDKTDDDNYA